MSAAPYTVVGARGFVGQAVCAALEASGHQVVALDRVDDPGARPLGRVVWCAGVTHDFRERPRDLLRADVTDLARVLEAGGFERLVYLSSTRVYRGAASGHETALLTVTPTDPDDLYNASKLAAEALCAAHAGAGTRVARLATVCAAATGSPDVLSRLARAALAHRRVTFLSDLGSARDYIGMEDAVTALVALSERGDEPVYNIASGRSTSNRELAGWLTELTGAQAAAAPQAQPVRFPTIDTARAQRDLGLRPGHPRALLAAIVAAERASLSG